MALKTVLTEDLGKTVEYALCLALKTSYDGAFKYSLEKANTLATRFAPLSERFRDYVHTGRTSKLNDFTSADGLKALSVKTTKSGYKICPQVIGQTTKKRFAKAVGLPEGTDVGGFKDYITANVAHLMDEYTKHTFHCPVLFYNEKENKCFVLEKTGEIAWADQDYKFTRTLELWNESNTLKVRRGESWKTLGEFQIHQHRDGVKFRFDLKNLMDLFPGAFTVEKVASS